MQTKARTSGLKSTHKMLEVLSSVVIGDAEKEDLADLLKREEADSLASVNRLLKRGETAGTMEASDRANAKRHGKRPSSVANKHRTLAVPVLLNGTLYDPKDMKRFDDQALHYVPAAHNEYMLAVDDVNVMVNWWRLLRLAALEDYRDGHYGSGKYNLKPSDPPGSQPSGVAPQDHKAPPGPEGPVSCWFVFSYLYEHAHFQGDRLTLELSRCPGYDYAPQQYGHLGHVSRGFLGLGDWNDIVSSVWVEHGTCILYEHRYYGVLDGGSSLTLTQNENYLERLGWNDLASSAEAF